MRTLVPPPTPDGRRRFDAVLFDFGGVLIDSPLDAFAAVEHRHGLPEGFIRQVNATNHLDNAWARFERNELSFDEFRAAFGDETEAAGCRLDVAEVFELLSGTPRPAMIDALRRLRQWYLTGLLTNNFAVPIGGDRRLYDEIVALFDAVVASADEGIRKPEPAFYQLACQRLGITPDRAVFLDDLGVNLKPARALGMATIKVVDADQALVELEETLGVPLGPE